MSSDTDALSALIARLEKAEGPSRELDAEIALAAGWTRIEDICGDGTRLGWIWTAPIKHGVGALLPRFSASLDAALTLVPEGWTRAVDATAPECGIKVDLFDETDVCEPVSGDHKSEPIATVIAALKARLALLRTAASPAASEG